MLLTVDVVSYFYLTAIFTASIFVCTSLSLFQIIYRGQIIGNRISKSKDVCALVFFVFVF